ncbi:MAG: hypothetical protein HY873_09680, partial [Chloroflexi bacterium]|nr:hypothetical protein [Chloroflexota bacterium]
MPDFEREHVSRERLLARLPDDGAPGSTLYTRPHVRPAIEASWLDDDARTDIADAAGASDTGSVLFVRECDLMLVLPPFAVETALTADRIDAAPLVELLERRRTIALYPSMQRRAAHGLAFNEDERRDYDVLDYDIEAT